MNAAVWPYRAQDLGRVLRLWDEPAPLAAGDGLSAHEAVDLISAESSVAVVAEEVSGSIVGGAVGESSSVVGWICKLAVTSRVDDRAQLQRFREHAEHFSRF